MDIDQEYLQQTYRRERTGSYPELPHGDHVAATSHYPVSSWNTGLPLPDTDNSSTGQSQSDAEETRAALKRRTSRRNSYVRKQTDFNLAAYGQNRQPTNDKKTESMPKPRYDSDPWVNWNSNAQSQPMHHHEYRPEYPQPASGNPNPFVPSVITPYASDNRHPSANYDHRPYVMDRYNAPAYAQPWPQPTSTVSMPYSLLGPRLDTGAKDFSSYSFATPPNPPAKAYVRKHGVPRSSHDLPDRLQSKGSDDSADDHRGAVLQSDGLHTGRSEASSSQTKKSRRRPRSRHAEPLATKRSFAPEPFTQPRPPPVLSTLEDNSNFLGGAEAVPLPLSGRHSPMDLELVSEDDVLPPLPPSPKLGRDSSDRVGVIHEHLSQNWPYTGEHTESALDHPGMANDVRPDQNKTQNDDAFTEYHLVDLLGKEEATKAKAATKSKNTDRKAKAAKHSPEIVDFSPPPMPMLPNPASEPLFQPGQEPEIIGIRPMKQKIMKIKPSLRSGFTARREGQPPKPSRKRPGYTSAYAQRVRSLMWYMPHLGSLYSFARDLDISPVITRLDYKKTIENPRRKSRRVFRSREWVDHDLRAFAKKISSGGTSSAFLRVLFVEDLSAALIDKLGTLYGVDPELFASHLASAGSSSLSYDDLPPGRWSTAKMRKSYYSLKWYRPVRLEKRVSQWLRDPKDLAKLGEDGIQWSETTHERWRQEVHETRTHHHVTLDNNIFRRSWPLSSDPDGAPGDGLHAAWEERASVFITRKEGLTISKYLLEQCSIELFAQETDDVVIILLDPLPVLTDTQTIEETVYGSRLSLPLAKGRKTLRSTTSEIKAFQTIAPRAPTDFPVNKMDATDRDLKALGSATKKTSSTRADIESWIWRLYDPKNPTRSGTTDPLVAVLRLACIDSTDYLDNLSWTLDEITRHSLDESIMIKRLPAWRKLLRDLEIELPTLGQDLHDFIEPTHAAFSEVAYMLADIDNRIAEVLGRVRNVYAVLRSEMALLDSSRSIAEARTVAKLTELAFAFIPLTFACSIFSMQITELQNGAPFWAFLVTAVAMGMITYAVRLVLQSNALSKLRRDATTRMMASSSSTGDQEITMGKLLKHLIGRLWQHRQPVVTLVVFLTALAIPVIPIAFLWSRNHMDVGFNAMLTVLTLPAGIMLAWYAQSAFRDATESEDGSDDYSSVAHLSMSEWLAMRAAPLLGRRRRRHSMAESTSDEEA